MKILQTAVALLATAILCIALASCDRKLTKSDASSAEKLNEEAVNRVESSNLSATNVFETLENHTAVTDNVLVSTNTNANGETSITPTKVSTTVPATTKPAATTAVHLTTVPSTTAVATTAPVTTTVPTTTAEATTVPPAAERPTDIVTDSEDMDNEQAVIAAINKNRAAEGLGELTYSPELSAAADIRAKEIVTNFSHIRPDGNLWYTAGSGIAAENIAKGPTTAYAVTNAWMNSEGHKKNILTKTYTTTGVGCYYDSATNTYYWVQLFG